MTTGTIIMIGCAVLYGLIVIFFKDDRKRREDNSSLVDDRFIGADGLLADVAFAPRILTPLL